MTYIPQSKINKLRTGGNEFIDAITKENYIGPYLEYSNNTYRKGSNSKKPGDLLLKNSEPPPNFNETEDNILYSELNKTITDPLFKNRFIPISKPLPQEEDYKKGSFKRYFCKRVNEDLGYFEISKETFISISNKEEKYDYNLHIVGFINWAIIQKDMISNIVNMENSQTIEEMNKFSLSTLNLRYPNLSVLFPDLREYAPLKAQPGQFFTKRGKPYTGYYHIHPDKGPMEGAFHRKEKHEILLDYNPFDKKAIITRGRPGRVIAPTRSAESPARGFVAPSRPAPSRPAPSRPAPSRPSSSPGSGGGYVSGGGGGSSGGGRGGY